METLAPPVVAVVVAHDPGPWFEETLASLGSQDYSELSVLVLDSAGAEDLTVRVAAVLPTAYVRRFDQNRGFGATANEVLTMVDGADFFLFCHDDVALFPDAVHLMVEEAFRSNAAVVAPKMVSWDNPDRLVHVGMAVDKGGSVVDRLQPNEIDHGQHDAVRDVFVAPGGCTLVRCDLFEEVGGFDPAIVLMGEDLDLCWRAQVAGARIIVAPDARVSHLEVVAGGSRRIPDELLTDSERGRRYPVSLQELQRRHELFVVLSCYGRLHLLRVLPQVVVLNVGEVIVAAVARNHHRARAVVRAWGWNIRRIGIIRQRRRRVKGGRRLADREVRLLQLRGSARLSAYARRVFQFGFHGAHSDELEDAEGIDNPDWTSDGDFRVESSEPGIPVPVSAPTGTSVDHTRVSGKAATLTWSFVAVVLLIGFRGLLSGPLPSVGQFVPFPSWASTFAQFGAGWHPSGVGSTAPATPALALVAAVGTVFVGAMGLTWKVLLFGSIPIGVWGVVRLMRPFGSPRASLVAGVSYAALPLAYNALALGRMNVLVVYAGAPWVFGHLFRCTGLDPFRPTGSRPMTTETPGGGSGTGRAPRVMNLPWGRRWPARHRTLRSVLLLGVLEAILISFVPATAIVVVLVAMAVVASAGILGQWRSAGHALWLALGSTAVGGVLCLPWLIGVVTSGRGAIAVFGVPTPSSTAASWGSLLRFSLGPVGDSPLAWGFGLAALLPLLLARGVRFRWTVRCWSIALVSFAAAFVAGRGWTGGLAVDPMVLLGPASVAVSLAIGLGIAAFEEDLRAAAFGWRQVVTVMAASAIVIGALPTVEAALPGRWDLPQNDFAQTLDWMHAKTAQGAFRVLWLGDARALNQGSWTAGDGLAYATSENGVLNASWLWNATNPGPAAQLASSVNLARSGRTDQLGGILATSGIRYVVLVTALAPVIPSVQSPEEYPVPADLTPALGRQLDLAPVLTESGITVYEDADWLPERSATASAVPVAASQAPRGLARSPGARVIPGAIPVLPGAAGSRRYQGVVPKGTVFTSLAPAGRWDLVGPGGVYAPRASSFGWAGRYQVAVPGRYTLRFSAGWWWLVAIIVQLGMWMWAANSLIERRWMVRRWARLRGRRQLRRREGAPARLLLDDEGEFGSFGDAGE
jgi:GT2 family glycosyltransferase